LLPHSATLLARLLLRVSITHEAQTGQCAKPGYPQGTQRATAAGYGVVNGTSFSTCIA